MMHSSHPYRLALAPLAALGFLLLVGCAGGPSPTPMPAAGDPDAAISVEDFQSIIDTLCADVMEGRDAGTEGIDIARDYLVMQLSRAGLEPGFVVDGKRSYTQAFEIPIGRNDDGTTRYAQISNVGAILPGSGDLADEFVIIGAHYDHIGYGDIGSRAPQRHGEIHPGADDNASGTAGVILLARHMADFAKANPDTPRRSILFTNFAGEERGLHGSRFEAQNSESWPFEISDISGMINMDMIGRLREDKLIVFTTETGEQWRDWVTEANGSTGDPLGLSMDERVPGGSDHTSFIQVGVPAVFFFTGLHAEYHTPDDTPETLNYPGAARVLRVVGATLERTATDPSRVTWVPPPPRTPRPFMGVMLGDTEEEGVLIEDVVDGGPADEAGIQPGDLIVHMGDEDIAGFRAMRSLIQSSKPGDEVAVVVIRDGERVELTLEFGAR